MGYPAKSDNRRREIRVAAALPAQIHVGSQLILQGSLRDLSSKSAFITMKTNSVFLQANDEIGFSIQQSLDNPVNIIQGLARIARIVQGEGLAIYFTRLDGDSADRLRVLVKI